jgi:hypothetical protein
MSPFALALQLGDECLSIGLAGIVKRRDGSSPDITDRPDDSHPRGRRRLGAKSGFGFGPRRAFRLGFTRDPHRLGRFRSGSQLPPIECTSCHEEFGPAYEDSIGRPIAALCRRLLLVDTMIAELIKTN